MKLENQVCAIEQAKRLKELGIDQVSLIYYLQCFVNNIESMPVVPKFNWQYGDYILNDSVADALSGRCKNIVYSAFSVAELGAMLPDNPSPDINYAWYHRHIWKGHSVGYSCTGVESIQQDWFKTEAEARAAMLIYLLENNYITAENCNKALQA